MVRTIFRIFLLLTISVPVLAQEPDVAPYLKQIEAGNASEAKEQLKLLTSRYPASPSVMFLDAVLTEDGRDAVTKYSQIVENHPESNYADVSLYRIYSYYFALGFYNTAKTYLERIKNEYPASPYIKIAERHTPDEDLDKPFLAAGDIKPETIQSSTVSKATALKDNRHEANKNANIKGAKYTIQAGAFLSVSNARNLKSALEAGGYYSEVKEKEIGGSILNVVYAGRFKSADEAKPVLETINKEYKLSGRIVPLN